MMTEKYPTWLTGHVKEWAEKRLPTVTLCSSTGKELLEVWYCGDLLTVKGEPQSYIVDGDEVPGLVAARDPESGEEFVIFDGGRHGQRRRAHRRPRPRRCAGGRGAGRCVISGSFSRAMAR